MKFCGNSRPNSLSTNKNLYLLSHDHAWIFFLTIKINSQLTPYRKKAENYQQPVISHF